MRCHIVALLSISATQIATAQQASRASPVVQVSAVHGRAQFAVPANWVLIESHKTDSLEQFAYYIPKPGVDTTSGASTNLIVNIRTHSAALPFKDGTSRQLTTLLDTSALVLDDTVIGNAQRAVWWRGQDGPWVYMGFDDFGRVRNLWVHLRIVEPLTDKAPKTWGSQFESETRAVLQSFVIDGMAVFPVLYGYPAVTPGPGS